MCCRVIGVVATCSSSLVEVLQLSYKGFRKSQAFPFPQVGVVAAFWLRRPEAVVAVATWCPQHACATFPACARTRRPSACAGPGSIPCQASCSAGLRGRIADVWTGVRRQPSRRPPRRSRSGGIAGHSGRNYGVVQIKPDSSISASFRSSASNPVALEVVTPVLTLANGLDFLRRLLGAISASVFLGGMKVNRSCGTHLHLGTAEWLLSKTKVFIVNFTFYQEVFAALSPPSRRTNNFCKRMPCHESFVQALLRCTSVAEIKELFGFDRYFRLNVQRLGEASPTLEVRLATHSFNKVKHWIALFLRCCLSTGSQPWPRPAPSAPPAELLRSLYLQLTVPLPEPWPFAAKDLLRRVASSLDLAAERGKAFPCRAAVRLSGAKGLVFVGWRIVE